MSVFAVFDVETTGLSPGQGDRIVELAAVILDDQFRVLRTFDSLVAPNRSIPPRVTQVHGICNNLVRNAPTFSQLAPSLLECFAGVTHLVAHNASFDLSFLRAELQQCGIHMPQNVPSLCTMQMARRKAVASNAKLATVASALQISFPANAHRAMVDASVTARILSLLHDQQSPPADDFVWPSRVASSSPRNLIPRDSTSVTLHRLAQLGLTVTTPYSPPPQLPGIQARAIQARPTQSRSTQERSIQTQPVQIQQDRRLLSNRSDTATNPGLTPEKRMAQQPPDLKRLGIRCPHPAMNDSTTWTWYLFSERKESVPKIAAIRSMTETTVYLHLRQALRCRLVNIDQLANTVQIEHVTRVWRQLCDEEQTIECLAEALNAQYPRGLLSCVVDWLQSSQT